MSNIFGLGESEVEGNYNNIGRMYGQDIDELTGQVGDRFATSKGRIQDINEQNRANENAIQGEYGWGAKLNAARQMYQEPTAAEQRRIKQQALASGGVNSGASQNMADDSLNDLRQNRWQSALKNAAGMMDSDQDARLGFERGLGNAYAQGQGGIEMNNNMAWAGFNKDMTDTRAQNAADRITAQHQEEAQNIANNQKMLGLGIGFAGKMIGM